MFYFSSWSWGESAKGTCEVLLPFSSGCPVLYACFHVATQKIGMCSHCSLLCDNARVPKQTDVELGVVVGGCSAVGMLQHRETRSLLERICGGADMLEQEVGAKKFLCLGVGTKQDF